MNDSIIDKLDQILHQNCFAIFDVQPHYLINLDELKNKLRTLQKQYHPDKFVNSLFSQQSVIASSRINDAYNTLCSPLLRGIEILRLNGINFDLSTDKQLPYDFLSSQIELYEEIETATTDISLLNKIKNKLAQNIQDLDDKIGQNFSEKDYKTAIENIKKLAFYMKIEIQINEKIENLW